MYAQLNLPDNVVVFEGVLNETFVAVDCLPLFQKAYETHKQPVDIDFSQVKQANSIGILQWSQFIATLHIPLRYIRVPIWLVEHFNLCKDLLQYPVVSFYAPFYCPEKDTFLNVLLMVGKDVLLQDDYSIYTYNVLHYDESGARYEPDFVPSEYFHFLSVLLKKGIMQK